MKAVGGKGLAACERPGWTEEIPDEQWAVYQDVIDAARVEGIPFALGGAFAIATYTGRWRNTKDIDLYVLQRDCPAMVDAVTQAGLDDYYEVLPYDRAWIYRAHAGDIIVDVIWAMANGCAQVDRTWIEGGPEIWVRDECLRVVPPEEMIWGKLYVLQRDRCDWPDIFNLFAALGPELDWEHLLERVAEDRLLLVGALTAFTWLYPEGSRSLPDWLWERLPPLIPGSGPVHGSVQYRADLLDTRSWFVAAPGGDEG